MNPTQTPGGMGVGPSGTPPTPPPRQPEASVQDIPDTAFGFADEPQIQPTTQPVVPPVRVPAPSIPAPAPPQPPLPPQPVAAPPTMPAAVLPPQQVPAVPTLAANPVSAAPAPAAPATQAPMPAPIAPAAPPEPVTPPMPPVQDNQSGLFDPSKVPVTASSTSVNPLSSSFTPANGQHLPDDIAARITATPMQNSSDINAKIHRGNASSRFKNILSVAGFIVAIFAAAWLINQFIFQSYYVEGTSMTPTLQNNDRLIISKVERTLAAIQGKPYIPERGQIVVLDSSIVGLNGQREQLIKRAIGLPGDHIHIEGGNVIITNSQHPNGYDVTKDLGLTNLQATYVDSTIDLTVPQGQVFVMGDNREQGGSYDSRAFGPVEGNKIQGRLWGRILPVDKAQLF